MEREVWSIYAKKYICSFLLMGVLMWNYLYFVDTLKTLKPALIRKKRKHMGKKKLVVDTQWKLN